MQQTYFTQPQDTEVIIRRHSRLFSFLCFIYDVKRQSAGACSGLTDFKVVTGTSRN
jgi:hypothetical protein